MTTSASEIFANVETNRTGSVGADVFADEVHAELVRLTESLFFDNRVMCRRSIILAEAGTPRTSSLWLATGMAAILSNSVDNAVHVLAVESSAKKDRLPAARAGISMATDKCVLERIPATTPRILGAGGLADRLSTLTANGIPVIVHLPDIGENFGVLARVGPVDGVVLLIRAAHSRRAPLELIQRQLTTARVPLLGSVLLDRIYPIPEKLYRIL
jgi:hypothetical protein